MTDLHKETALSPAGERRREEILVGLGRALTARRRRRGALRAAGTGVAVVLVFVGAVMISRGRAPVGPTGSSHKADVFIAVDSPAAFTVVRDDPGILERVAVRRAAPAAASIDDDELERLLEEAGRPTGFVRTGGRVYLAVDFDRPADGDEAAPGT